MVPAATGNILRIAYNCLHRLHAFTAGDPYIRLTVGSRMSSGLEPEAGKHGQIKELAMKNLVSRFLKDQSGATAIEYGLIAAGISVAIIVVVNSIGSKLNIAFTNVQTNLR